MGLELGGQGDLEYFHVVRVRDLDVADARRLVHAGAGLEPDLADAFVVELDPAFEHVDQLHLQVVGVPAGGALLGFLIGGSIGRTMDQADQSCLEQSLEYAEDGQQITWNNPDSSTRYQVVPTKTTTMADGRYCREYTTTATVGGKAETVYGRACRQPDGAWQIES